MNDEQQNQAPNEEKPVKLSIGGTVALVVGLAIMLFIIVMTFKGCSVQKSVKTSGQQQSSEPVSTSTAETESYVPSESVILTESTAVTESTSPTSGGNSNNEGNGTSSDDNGASFVSNGFSEVAEPALSPQKEAFGMVIGKHVYQKDGAYIYGVSVSVIIDGQSVTAQYFCPRKSFESLRSGDSLSVVYQTDSAGAVSIFSISKS